jgi:hypothetical protein
MARSTAAILPRELWDIDQTAEALGVTRQYLYDRRHAGRAPGTLARVLSGRLVWDPDELHQWWVEGADPHWQRNQAGA